MLGPHIFGGFPVTRFISFVSSRQSACCCVLPLDAMYSSTLASVAFVLFSAIGVSLGCHPAMPCFTPLPAPHSACAPHAAGTSALPPPSPAAGAAASPTGRLPAAAPALPPLRESRSRALPLRGHPHRTPTCSRQPVRA